MNRTADYTGSNKILYGVDLENELQYRRNVRDQRINQKIGFRQKANELGIKPSEVLAWEYGYSCCPHEAWEDNAGGFPIPKILFKQCKKCGKVDSDSTEKVDESNFERLYEIYKRLYPSKENEDTAEK